jgi:phenylacetate-coenzyme A ligase PaaK-like adenylate-forming protein
VLKNYEVASFCSSGTTDQPRLIPWTYEQSLSKGLENQIRNVVTEFDRTFNMLPLWSSIGLQVFNVFSEKNAKFYILENIYDWPKIKPTFLLGLPSQFLDLIENTKEPYDLMTVRHIRTIGAPLSKEVKQKIQSYFNCITTDCYGMNEIGSISTMREPNDLFRKNRFMVYERRVRSKSK